MAKQSKRFSLNQEDIKKWAKNSIVFLAPFLLVFFVALQSGSDIKDALDILYLYALNIIVDILRKFIASK